MKYFLFVCQGLADEPSIDLGGRTPLEAAKTPTMDSLAQAGQVKQALFVPPNLEPMSDIALLSILGYDPQKFYTGLAPLEAPAFGVQQEDGEVLFRADLVTLLDEALMDPTASSIGEREAGILLNDLSTKFSGGKFHFRRGHGYKNYLAVRDESLLEDLDELECTPPDYCMRQKISKFVPKGRGSDLVIALMKEAGIFLENHEINRVRIDLGENPANRLWLWGQGKKPRLPLFEKQYGLTGLYDAKNDFVRGVAKSIGLNALKNNEKQPLQNDFILYYFGDNSESRMTLDLKSKIKRIEEFDVFLSNTLKAVEPGSFRVLVTGDVAESLSQKKATRAPMPIVISGAGILAEKNTSFCEKSCAQIATIEKGHEVLPAFLK